MERVYLHGLDVDGSRVVGIIKLENYGVGCELGSSDWDWYKKLVFGDLWSQVTYL
jgi:hypothetical protein